MDFKELLDYCQAQAIAHTLESTEMSVWRSLCRNYSKTFHTRLDLVLEMDPEAVMLAVFEEQLDDFDEAKDLDNLLDKLYALEDPEYESQKAVELDDFIERAEAEETERLKAGKPIHPAMKNDSSLPAPKEKPVEELPKSGKLNLSYLEREENPFGQFEE